jgi:hypothetical protein
LAVAVAGASFAVVAFRSPVDWIDPALGGASFARLEARGTEWTTVPSPEGVPAERRVGYDGALASSPRWSVAARAGGWCLHGRTDQRATR